MGWRHWGRGLATVLLVHTAAGAAEPQQEPEDFGASEVDAWHALSCEDIRPGALGPSRSFITRANAPEADCGPGVGDGAGFLALQNSGPLGATAWTVVSREGVQTPNLITGGDMGTLLLPQPHGFHNLRASPGGASLAAFASNGEFLRGVRLNSSWNVPFDVVADPRGGSLVAQWLPRGSGTQVLTFQFFDEKGRSRSGPFEVASAPLSESRLVIAGADTKGRVLLLWPEPGRDTWMGQWLKCDGDPLTQPFPVPKPSSGSTVKLAPLAGGGLAFQADGQWVLRFPSGTARAQPAPEWLASHPGTELVLIRDQRANVLVPPPVSIAGSGCQESLLFFASDGTACGELALPFGGGSCSGRRLGIGLDGTVIQQIELSIPANDQCAWRWWPGLLR